MSLFLYLLLSFSKSFILIGRFNFFIFLTFLTALLLYCKLCNDRLSDSSLNTKKDDNSERLPERGWRSGWSTRLPPMWPGFNSRRRRHMWVEFVVGSLRCSERFSSGYSGFPLSSKTNISKVQFCQESGRQKTTMWMCYLQTVICLLYLFIYLACVAMVASVSGSSYSESCGESKIPLII